MASLAWFPPPVWGYEVDLVHKMAFYFYCEITMKQDSTFLGHFGLILTLLPCRSVLALLTVWTSPVDKDLQVAPQMLDLISILTLFWWLQWPAVQSCRIQGGIIQDFVVSASWPPWLVFCWFPISLRETSLWFSPHVHHCLHGVPWFLQYFYYPPVIDICQQRGLVPALAFQVGCCQEEAETNVLRFICHFWWQKFTI